MSPEPEAAEIEPLVDDRSMIDAPEPVDLDPVAVGRMLRACAHRTRDLRDYDATADDERAEMTARHDAERRELEDRLTRNRQPLVETVGYLERRLELTGLARLAADPGAPTWTLNGGKLVVGGGGIEKEWGSEDDLREFAAVHCPEALTPQPDKVVKAAIWAFIKDDAVKTQHGRQAPATKDGTVTVDGDTVPIRIVAKPRTITVEPDLDAATGPTVEDDDPFAWPKDRF
jgi:hypothetical protein